MYEVRRFESSIWISFVKKYVIDCINPVVSNRITLLATFVATGHLNSHISIIRDLALI